ncbi:MAG: hypothetical protein ACRYG5_03185 [Janthinobacterium lividum]
MAERPMPRMAAVEHLEQATRQWEAEVLMETLVRTSAGDYCDQIGITCPRDRAILQRALIEHAYQDAGAFEEVLLIGSCQNHAPAASSPMLAVADSNAHIRGFRANAPGAEQAHGRHAHADPSPEVTSSGDMAAAAAALPHGVMHTLAQRAAEAVSAAAPGAAVVCQFTLRWGGYMLATGAATGLSCFVYGLCGSELFNWGAAVKQQAAQWVEGLWSDEPDWAASYRPGYIEAP